MRLPNPLDHLPATREEVDRQREAMRLRNEAPHVFEFHPRPRDFSELTVTQRAVSMLYNWSDCFRKAINYVGPALGPSETVKERAVSTRPEAQGAQWASSGASSHAEWNETVGGFGPRVRTRGSKASPPSTEPPKETPQETPRPTNPSVLHAAGQVVGQAMWDVADRVHAGARSLYNILPALPSFQFPPGADGLATITQAPLSADEPTQVAADNGTTATEPTTASADVTDTPSPAAGEPYVDAVLVRSADSLHRAMETTFSNADRWIRRYDRAGKILLQAMRRQPGMTEVAIEGIDFQARRFIDCVPNKFAPFASEELVADYIKRNLRTERREVVQFLNNKNRIVRELNVRPDATDSELRAFAQSVLSEPTAQDHPPVDVLEPFVRYVGKLRADLDWIDWDMAKRSINNPLQAINALYVFNHAGDERVQKLDGLALGERLANGGDSTLVIAGLSAEQRKQLDTASLLYELANGERLRLNVPTGFPFTETLPLGQQLASLRQAFLTNLRDEWLLSKMFVPNSDRDNVFMDGNALTRARGKTWQDLVDDPSVQRIPGFRALDREMQKQLVKRKLDRTGEATEYRFGTVQQGMATTLKRLILMAGQTPPDSFGTEAQLVERFIAVSNHLSHPEANIVSPWLMLGQYLEQVTGEKVTSPTASPKQNAASLLNYVKERFSANYGAPEPFDRSRTALNIMRSQLANTTTTEHDLTQVKREFPGNLFGQGGRSFDERKLQTPLEHFLYLADNPSTNNRFVFNGQVFRPRAQLQRKEREYNEKLEKDPWVDARAKENIRESGQTPNDANLPAARQAVLAAAHAKTETERQAEKLRKVLFGTPVLGNILGVLEGLANRDWGEVAASLPEVGPVYEFVAGLVTGDWMRSLRATPVFGTGLQVVEAMRDGDSEDIEVAVGAFVLDVGSLGGARGVSGARTRAGETGHVVMKHAELSNGHAVGLRNVRAMTKSLGVTLKRHPAHAEAAGASETLPAAAWEPEKPRERPTIGPGDPYGIELSGSLDHISEAHTPSISDPKRFGAEYEPYRVAGPSAGVEPNSAGIYQEGNNHFIRDGDHFYAVRYDANAGTWRVHDRNNAAKWARPVEYKDGHWQYNDHVGLRGGAPLNDAQAAVALDKLFNPQLKSLDAFRWRRERFVKDNDRAYPEQSFDVEGLPHQWKPAVCSATGQPYFDIRTHGRPYAAMSIHGKRASPKEFAAHMTGYLRHYKAGTPIRLIACWTGLGGRFSFAQRLANLLGVPVLAYTGRVDLLKAAAAVRKEKLFMPSANRSGPRHTGNAERRMRRSARVRRSAGGAGDASKPGAASGPTPAPGPAADSGDSRARLREIENSLRGWVNYGNLRRSAPNAGAILRAVFQTYGTPIPESFQQTADLASLQNSPLVEEAAVLYQQLTTGATSEGDCSIEPLTLEQIRSRFADAIADEHQTHLALKVLFAPAPRRADRATVQVGGRTHSLPAGPSGAVHFNGFTMRNAMGKSFEDLLETPSLWSNPTFATWDTEKKRALLRTMFAEIGEDTQYAIGTVQHSLKTALARVAKYNGQAVVDRFDSDEALLQAFGRLESQWNDDRSTFPLHPRLLFAMHLADTNGIAVVGSKEVDQLARRAFSWVVTSYAAGKRDVVRWLERNLPMAETAQEQASLLLDLLRDICLEPAGRPDVPAQVREIAMQLKQAGVLAEFLVADTWQDKVAAVLRSGNEQLLAAFGDTPTFVRGDERLRTDPWAIATARANVRKRSGEVTKAAEKRELDRMLSGGFQAPAENRGPKSSTVRPLLDTIPSVGSASSLAEAMRSKPAEQTVLGDINVRNGGAGAVGNLSSGKPVPAHRARGLANFLRVVSSLGIPTNGVAEKITTAKVARDVPDIRVQDGTVPLESRHLALQVRAGLAGVQWQGHDVVLLADEDRVVPIERAGDGYREIDWNTGRPALGAKPIRRDSSTGPFRVDWR